MNVGQPWWMRLCLVVIVTLSGMGFVRTVPPASRAEQAMSKQTVEDNPPQVLYTDIVSGPNTGGENNQGIYLSLFGVNFGQAGLGSTLKVYINDVEVANYRYLGASKGRGDIQQITVQVGTLGNPISSVPLPIKVVVDGVASNTDQHFMVNPGRILFVDPNQGDDVTALISDLSKPFKTVQAPDLQDGAWGAAQPARLYLPLVGR